MKRSVLPLAALFVWLTSCMVGSSVWAQTNVLVVVYDDVDVFGDLEPYGANPSELQTPFSNILAGEGKKFERFYSNGVVCSPTRVSLTSGLYPNQLGFNHVVGGSSDRGVPSTYPTLARFFGDLGYSTGAFGKWHIGSSRPEYLPDGVGFDDAAVSCGFTNISDYFTTKFCGPTGTSLPGSGMTHATVYTVDKALDFIAGALNSPRGQAPGPAAEPFFAQVWLHAPHDPHGPSQCPPGYTCGSGERAVVAAMIDHAETQLMRLHADLTARGVWDDTLVILTSDNGGAPGVQVVPYSGLSGSKGGTLERGIRVPFLVKGPGIAPGTVEEATISHDLLTTFSDYFDTPLSGYLGSGLSFANLLTGGSWSDGGRGLFWDAGNPATSLQHPLTYSWMRWAARKEVQGQTYKAVQTNLWSGGVIPELYNLTNDEAETNNLGLSGSYAAIRNSLQSEFNTWRMESSAHLPEIAGSTGAVSPAGNGFVFAMPEPGQELGQVSLVEHPAMNPGALKFAVSFTITPSALPIANDPIRHQSRLIERSGSWQVLIQSNHRIAFVVKQLDGPSLVVANKLQLTAGTTYRVTAVYESTRGLTLYVNDIMERVRTQAQEVPGSANGVILGSDLSNTIHPYLGTLNDLVFHPIVVRPEDLELSGAYSTGFEITDPAPFENAGNGSVSIDYSQFHRGSRSLRHVSTAADSYTRPLGNAWHGAIAVASGAESLEYQLNVWVKGAVGEERVAIFLFCKDSQNVPIGGPWQFSSSSFLASTSWRRITHQHQCPAGTHSLGFRLDNDLANQTVYWDDVSIGRIGKAYQAFDFESGTSSPIFAGSYPLEAPGRNGGKSMVFPSQTTSEIQVFPWTQSANSHFTTSFWARYKDEPPLACVTDPQLPGCKTVLRLWFYCRDSAGTALDQSPGTGNCPTGSLPPSTDLKCIRSNPAWPTIDWQKYSLSASCPVGTAQVAIRFESILGGPMILIDDLTVSSNSIP